MKFVQEKIDDVLVVRIQEKSITSHEAPELKTALLGFLIGDTKKILMNFKEVQNMDSTGLGALLFGIRQAERYEKDIRYCEMQSKILFLIRIAHLENAIDLYETEKDGLKDFQDEETNA